MLIKNLDKKGNIVDFEKIEKLVLNNSVCNAIISHALEDIKLAQKNEER